ncbi:MAG: DUF58 domain-containing protein [Ginsengibacter sp.]
MNFTILKNKVRRNGFFIPLRFQLVLLIASMLFGWNWLRNMYLLPQSSFTAIAGVFIMVTFWFLTAIILFAFITSMGPWLFFLIAKKNGRVTFEIKKTLTGNTIGKQKIFLFLHPIVKPFFGNIRLRLQYNDNISGKFTLVGQKASQIISTTESGYYFLPLTDIKQYNVTGSLISFEDMFQFFSFTAFLPTGENFVVQPKSVQALVPRVRPRKTQEINTRIDEMRKVEGELLNYKNFEHNDDVRRIVWKIYAKNKELMIRIPETNDPSASHTNFYASFYNALNVNNSHGFNKLFLNHYKTAVWNCYFELTKQNERVSYLPDQQTGFPSSGDQVEKVKQLISVSVWHQQNKLGDYFKKNDGSVLCVSSLVDPAELEHSMENSPKELLVVFVMLSKIFNETPVDWIKWLFIKPVKNTREAAKLAWYFSPVKRKLISNEKNILNILNKSTCVTLIQ